MSGVRHTKVPEELAWNENEPEPMMPKWNTPMEERIDLRRGVKRLCDCALPDGFRLVYERPRQMWIEQQMRWCFMLGFEQTGRDEVTFVARYEPNLPDEVQLRWALTDFAQALGLNGYSVSQGVVKSTPQNVTVPAGRLSTHSRMSLGMVH